MENNDLLKEQAKRLRQVKDEITLVNNATSRSAGMGGTIAVATTYTGNFESLVVNEDAVIAVLEYSDEVGVNKVTALGLNAFTVTKGMLLTPPYGKLFGKITLASGTVLVYA